MWSKWCELWAGSEAAGIEIPPQMNVSSSFWESSETSSCVSFYWFVPQQSCRLENPTPWQACTHRNWFHLAVGSPWQFEIRNSTSSFDWPIGLLDPVPLHPADIQLNPLRSTLVSGDFAQAWFWVQQRFLSHRYFSNYYSQGWCDCDTVRSSVCYKEASLIRAFVDEGFQGESQWVWGISTYWCMMVHMHLCVHVGDCSVGRFEFSRLTLSTLDWARQGGKGNMKAKKTMKETSDRCKWRGKDL